MSEVPGAGRCRHIAMTRIQARAPAQPLRVALRLPEQGQDACAAMLLPWLHADPRMVLAVCVSGPRGDPLTGASIARLERRMVPRPAKAKRATPVTDTQGTCLAPQRMW